MTEVKEKTNVTPLGDGNETAYQLGIIFDGDEFADSISFDWLGDTYQVVYTDENGLRCLLLLHTVHPRTPTNHAIKAETTKISFPYTERKDTKK